jgi:hypothetical protein
VTAERPFPPAVAQTDGPNHVVSMYFICLATDYDGTLAEDGAVAEETISFRHEGVSE